MVVTSEARAAKRCNNCGEVGFSLYRLCDLPPSVPHPKEIFRCNACGITIDLDELNSLAEDPNSPA